MFPGSTPDLEGLKNIGTALADRLRAVGINTPQELLQAGAVPAYARLRQAFPEHTTLVTLYSLHGALTDRRWHDLPAETRAALQDAAINWTES